MATLDPFMPDTSDVTMVLTLDEPLLDEVDLEGEALVGLVAHVHQVTD